MDIKTTKTKQINGFSHHEIGDDHLYTGLETPIKKDAFILSDIEKKKKISILFEDFSDIQITFSYFGPIFQ